MQNVAILNEYFDQKRGLANGISMAGGTLGAFVMSPLLEWSLDQFGLFDSYLLLAAIGAFTVPAALILRSNKRKLIPLSPAKRPNLSSVFSKHHPSAIFTQPSLKSSSVPPALGHVNSTCTTSMEQLQVPLPSNTFAKPKTYDFYRAPVERPKTTIASKLKKVFSHVDFYLVMGSHLAYFWGVITFNMVVVDLLQDNHLPLNSASHMITAFAFGDLVGRAGTGKNNSSAHQLQPCLTTFFYPFYC